jgi:hypothetical protein
MTIEERLAQFKTKPYRVRRFGRTARNMRQAMNKEFGVAMTYRGAVKAAKLKKLTRLAEDIPGYKLPEVTSE